MRWFKHYTDTKHSLSLADLEQDLGFEGIGRYWRFIEFIASMYQTDTDQSPNGWPLFRVHSSIIRETLRIRSWNGLRSFVERLATIRGLNLEWKGNILEIEAPILLELKDRDFKETRKKREQNAPKRKRKRKEREEEEEREEEKEKKLNQKKPPLSPVPDFSASDLMEFWNSNCGSLPVCKTFSDSRRVKANRELKKYPAREHWESVVKEFKSSKFCLDTWRPGFDDFLSEAKRVSALEGKYRDKGWQKTREQRVSDSNAELNRKILAGEFDFGGLESE